MKSNYHVYIFHHQRSGFHTTSNEHLHKRFSNSTENNSWAIFPCKQKRFMFFFHYLKSLATRSWKHLLPLSAVNQTAFTSSYSLSLSLSFAAVQSEIVLTKWTLQVWLWCDTCHCICTHTLIHKCIHLCLEADSQRAEHHSCDTVGKGKTSTSKYLHVAILVPVGEDVPIDVSKRRNPGQNWRVCCYISRLQVPRGINVWGLKRRPERITIHRNMLSMMWSTIHLADSDRMA